MSVTSVSCHRCFGRCGRLSRKAERWGNRWRSRSSGVPPSGARPIWPAVGDVIEWGEPSYVSQTRRLRIGAEICAPTLLEKISVRRRSVRRVH